MRLIEITDWVRDRFGGIHCPHCGEILWAVSRPCFRPKLKPLSTGLKHSYDIKLECRNLHLYQYTEYKNIKHLNTWGTGYESPD